MAQEIISNCFNNSLAGGILLKLDFAKVYDILDCHLIMEVLKAKGFGAKRLGWIQTVLFGGKSQILINEKPGRIILFRRSLRQGDPLSPLFFI